MSTAAGGSGIEVTVNGRPMRVPTGSTVAQLIESLRLDRGRLAVEVNLRVVPRAEHARVALNHGDKVEVVTFVGGG